MPTYREPRKHHGNPHRFVPTLIAATLALMAAAVPVRAEPSAAKRPGAMQACQADARSLCAEAVSSGDRKAVAKCLVGQKDKVGTACVGALRRAHRVAAFRRACAPSVKSLCGGVERGDGRILQCLRQNEAGLPDDCKNRVGKPKTRQGQKDVAAVASEALAEERAGTEPLGDELAAVPEEAPVEPVPPAPPETTSANAP